MRRRDFMVLLGSAAAALPMQSIDTAGQSVPRRIGYVAASGGVMVHRMVAALRQGLEELGYGDQSIVVEIRIADGRTDRLPELVRELIDLKVEVLVAANSAGALEAKKATSSVPIVIVASDPVGLGLVASLARPGGNVTGLSYFNEAIVAKRLEILREFLPRLSRVAVLKNPGVAIHGSFWQETEVAARKLGLTIQPLDVRGPEDFEAAFAASNRANAQALIAFDDALTIAHRTQIVALAAKSNLPAIYGLREFADDGGLVSYGPNFADLMRRSATYVVRILRGTKPSDLPVEQPTRFELVINRKVAKALGLDVPPSLLLRADEMIE